MNTPKITFRADKMDFSTLDASEMEFFSIEYNDPDFAHALGIDGKISLCVDDMFDKFSADLWIEGEPVMELDDDSDEIVRTGEEQEPHFMQYPFTPEELDAIKLRIVQYFHDLFHGGEEYALKESSCPFGKEAWRQKYSAVRTPTGIKYVFKTLAV